ncbi:MAG: Glutamate--cysteine ligase EgtA [Rhodospirillaceae bacterium]|jgi:glutamate--cysteine ligase|nr:MAG: Glutamate--cysteine ligase EgtA [Rhodospirillaceae bacterium]
MNENGTAQPVTDRAQLIEWFAERGKPKSAWRIGTEHEKFLFRKDSFKPVAYEGGQGVGELLRLLEEQYDMQPIIEKGLIIGLKSDDGGSITLEPGGQLELSGAPLESLHETCAETGAHLRQMREITQQLELCMLGVGFQPLWQRRDISWMPKGRYKIMREYMPKRGQLGLDMMLRSCTVQVNLDYEDERDMVRKFRTSLALQPIATALFANSPFKDGQPSGLKSTRAEAWTDTDPDRCGVPGFVFDDDFGYARWVDYILDVPMYFLHRGEDYLDVSGLSFRDFMAGSLPGFEGQFPSMADFEDHVTTAFPEVRLKGYLEMRGADGGSWGNICALPALWVGLLYDDGALDAAESLIKGITASDVEAARMAVAKDGLQAEMAGRSVHKIAHEVLEIAEAGLKSRKLLDSKGEDERKYLAPLQEIVKSGKTYADEMLDKYYSAWDEDITHIFKEYHY